MSSFVFVNDVLIMSGSEKHTVWYRCVIQYLQVILCAEGGEGLFAMIIHKRNTVVYILNTLIPSSTSPLPRYLPATGALITVGDDAVILRGWGWVGGRVRARDRQKENERESRQNLGGICFPQLPPLALSPSPLSL